MTHLDQGSDHAERRQAQVLEGALLADSVEERIQVQGDVGWNGAEREGRQTDRDSRETHTGSVRVVGHKCCLHEHKHAPFMSLDLVSGWDATHCSNARALHTLLLACGDKVGGDSMG